MMNIWRLQRIFLLRTALFSIWVILWVFTAGATGALALTRFNVGYRVIDLKYPGHKEKPLTVAVWYPTAAQPKPYNYGGATNGKVALSAAPLVKESPYSLLVFSHGYGGRGIGYVFFTEALAARGWIVAAFDHHDRYSAVRIRQGQLKDFNRRGFWQHVHKIVNSKPADRDKYLYRMAEMKSVLDSLIVSELFCHIIDRNRIAVVGNSFGGYTMLGLCGPIEKYRDSRIKAVLLFSTAACGYLFTEDELRALRILSMLFIGEREKDQLRGDKTMS